MFHSLDQYRDNYDFDKLLQSLRQGRTSCYFCTDDDAVPALTSSSALDTSSSALSSSARHENKKCRCNHDNIVFLTNPIENEDDQALGRLGDALLVHLQTPQPYVKYIDLTIQHLTTNFQSYQSILQYIERSQQLEGIVLNGHGDYNRSDENVHHSKTVTPHVIEEFLLSIQKNTNLKTVVLLGCQNIPVHTFDSFLQYSSIKVLQMDCSVTFTGLPTTNSLQNVASNMTNSSIQILHIELSNENIQDMDYILASFQFSHKLQSLRVDDSICDAVQPHEAPIRSLQNFISATRSLQNLELINLGLRNESENYMDSVHHFLDALFSVVWNQPSIVNINIHNSYIDIDSIVFATHIPRFLYLKVLRLSSHQLPPTDDDIFIKTVLPRNISIQQIYVDDCQPEFDFIPHYIARNCGIQQLIQQYVPNFMLQVNGVKVDQHVDNKDVKDCTKSTPAVSTDDDFSIVTAIAGSSNEDNTSSNSPTTTTNGVVTIPMEVIPSIISNHLSFVDYGPTIIYQLISTLGSQIGSTS